MMPSKNNPDQISGQSGLGMYNIYSNNTERFYPERFNLITSVSPYAIINIGPELSLPLGWSSLCTL
jgi:hypothetical protein